MKNVKITSRNNIYLAKLSCLVLSIILKYIIDFQKKAIKENCLAAEGGGWETFIF